MKKKEKGHWQTQDTGTDEKGHWRTQDTGTNEGQALADPGYGRQSTTLSML